MTKIARYKKYKNYQKKLASLLLSFGLGGLVNVIPFVSLENMSLIQWLVVVIDISCMVFVVVQFLLFEHLTHRLEGEK